MRSAKIFSAMLFIVLIIAGVANAEDWHTVHNNVASDKVWYVEFSSAVDPTTIDNQNIYVSGTDTSVTLGTNGNTVTVSPPTGGYTAGQTYYLIVCDEVKSQSGKKLGDSIRMQFTISNNSGFTAEEYLNQAIAKFKNEDYAETINYCTQAIEINPDYALAYIYRSWAYSRLEQYDTALTDANRAVDLDSQNLMAYAQRGNVYNLLGDQEKAISDYSIVITLTPDNADSYYMRGNSYFKLEEYDNAISDYTRAIELEQDNKRIHYNRGLSHCYLSEYTDAIPDFSKAIELDPDFKFAYYNRGRAYYYLDSYTDAIRDFTKVIELDPDYQYAYYQRGNVYYDQGQYTGAISDYTEAVEIDPEYKYAYNNRGAAYEQINMISEAIADYIKAWEIDPDFQTPINNLYRLGVPGFTPSSGFSDVDSNTIRGQAIFRINNLGIIDGYPDGTFGPDKTMTKAEFAKIICTLGGLDHIVSGMANTPSPFSDVSIDFWGNGWINTAAAMGYLTYYADGTFGPDNQINQAEAITSLLRVLGYNDNLSGIWPANYIAKATNLGILDDITFSAYDSITRGQLAIVINAVLDEYMVEYSAYLNSFYYKNYTLVEANF